MAEQGKSDLYKTLFPIVGILLIFFFAAVLLWTGNANSNQAINAMLAQVRFEGEYRIGDGPWQKIVGGEHISSTKGDVTLRGNFHMLTPDGEYVGLYSGDLPIALYINHINLTFYKGENDPYVLDMENPLFGDSVCGVGWTAHVIASESTEPIEILIHNPHRFGNENAIDELLSNTALWAGIDFEKGVLESGAPQRNTGLFFVIVALVLLGIALFSTLIHIKNSNLMWLLGLLILFAGAYFAYSAKGVSFWQESIVSNTTMLGIAMILYMLFLSIVIVYFLETTKKVGSVAVIFLGAVDTLFFVLSMITDLFFYDTWLYWMGVQLVVNLILFVCLMKECFCTRLKIRWFYVSSLLPLIAFGIDVVMTGLGGWQGGLVSKYVFVALFAVSMVVFLRIIPRGINAATKAKALETEKTLLNAQLTESRISTMMSQIRPHFIYNTLGSIEQLCEIDPEKAGRLVHNFAKYLRGNFGELDNPRPIQMSKEMEHVHYYISIERVRFPDMTFTFEMNSVDFCLPALTIQPIVENAIKHGLMKRDKGGSIRVVSYETNTHYCVLVEDDGMGFDTDVLLDDRTHMGIRNIRERLKAMVSGTIEIESSIGVGTKVLITIPKEVRK
jgi:sensor histidine kinase YesM